MIDSQCSEWRNWRYNSEQSPMESKSAPHHSKHLFLASFAKSFWVLRCERDCAQITGGCSVGKVNDPESCGDLRCKCNNLPTWDSVAVLSTADTAEASRLLGRRAGTGAGKGSSKNWCWRLLKETRDSKEGGGSPPVGKGILVGKIAPTEGCRSCDQFTGHLSKSAACLGGIKIDWSRSEKRPLRQPPARVCAKTRNVEKFSISIPKNRNSKRARKLRLKQGYKQPGLAVPVHKIKQLTAVANDSPKNAATSGSSCLNEVNNSNQQTVGLQTTTNHDSGQKKWTSNIEPWSKKKRLNATAKTSSGSPKPEMLAKK